MLQFYTQVALVSLQPFQRNSPLNVRRSVKKIAKKSHHKPSILEVQCRSKSSMLVHPKSSSAAEIGLSCNRFRPKSR